MGKVVDVLKAILTRLIFAGHGFIAIWRVTTIKEDPAYWYLSISLLVLAFEGIFTLTIKANQEWRWFCPSVFLYLSSVVPSIWLLEFDKLDKRLEEREGLNVSVSVLNGTTEELSNSTDIAGVKIPLALSAERWATVIQQLLMLILIIGRWLLPKGDLTRDQLSQLLLVYIGTAADIIEFFDSFKDDKVASNRVLCIIILAIWSWSLLQFTMVLTASPTKTKKAKVRVKEKKHNCCHTAKNVCCSVDVWSILINIILQDAPFFIFRLLLILHYKIISETNIFFTCKNTLVITLQFYRLIVVHAEKRKGFKSSKQGEMMTSKQLSSNASKKRGTSPGGGGGGVDSTRNLRGTRIVKVNPGSVSGGSRGSKLPPKRAVAKLVRTASEDDGAAVYPSPAHSGAFLLHTENDTSWRQYSRGRRRSLSTGDLSVTAEMSVEIDSSPDRSTCFSADLGGGCDEVGDIESDFEAERLSNLEEEDNDNEEVNDDVESQSSPELEYSREKATTAFNADRKRRGNSRYGTVDEVRSIPSPKPRAGTSQGRPVPMPRKAAVPMQPLNRSPTNRSVSSRCSTNQSKDKKRTTRQDTGYSTGSSASARESQGNGKRVPGRAMTPSRDGRDQESRRGAARPRDLGRPIPGSSKGSNLQELELCELSSPTRVSRSSSKSNRPSRKSNSGSSSRREPSVDYDEGGQDNCSLGGEDEREDEFHLEAVSRQT
ncbi:uncharacterized protein LOC124349488 isoform X2 [Daphnia pulicaria]|uniref:uncharacterized protein LOC124349488 isoform X2 n=1 Tax=Daphnia pulicaria TaxID=35523 RepID=UPI001EEB0566|nr:uncharacterized protein LOC124349488 isoform X2 [Daphnia pulicaria]